MTLCCEKSLVKFSDDGDTASVLRCNMWSCDFCRAGKRRSLIHLAKAGEPTLFITLTSSEETSNDPNEAAQALVHAWRITVKRIKRHYKIRSFPYITVIEATKKGRPHLHILARAAWLSQRWLSEVMQELIAAPIVWIEAVRATGGVASYLAKYLGKEPAKFLGCKRFWRSLDWIKDKTRWQAENEKQPGIWHVRSMRIEKLARHYEYNGWLVTWHSPNAFEAVTADEVLRRLGAT